MTRINVVSVQDLTDQHLMAEYRELPMVVAAARRSKPDDYIPTNQYTLNKGHVKFFYNKKKWLYNRWCELIEELKNRGYDIDPTSRIVEWHHMDKFPQSDWAPDVSSRIINIERLEERILAKPHWYRYRGVPLTLNQ